MEVKDLDELMLAVLQQQRGLTARELAAEIRARRRGSCVTRRDVNQVLYADGRFRSDGGRVPRWAQVGDAIGRTDRAVTTSRVRAEMRRLDELMEHLTATSTTPIAEASHRAEGPGIWHGDWRLPGLRPWQQRALSAWFAAGSRGVVEAVTGTGKTHLGLEAAARMAATGGATTILVPTTELQRQWAHNLVERTPTLSIALVGGQPSGSTATADVTIALVQTARNRDLTPHGRPGLLVADETHRYGSRGWSEALRDGYTYRLGLTATLEREGDSGVNDYLMPYFGRTVFSYDYSSAVPEGVVAPFTLAQLGVNLSFDEQSTYDHWSRKLGRARAVLGAGGVLAGSQADINLRIAALSAGSGRLAEAARDHQKAARNRRKVLADCAGKVRAIARLAPVVQASRGTVVFSQGIDASEAAANTLRLRGVPASAVHSKLDADERRENLDALRDQSITALCAPRILDEGIDIPNIDLGIVMSASSTQRQMIQRLGRVIRLKEGGAHARFVVLYARGTVEDPAEGAHQGFMQMVHDVAARRIVLDDDWDARDVLDGLALPVGLTSDALPDPPPTPVGLGRATADRAASPWRPQEAATAMEHRVEPPHARVTDRYATCPPDILDWIRTTSLDALADALLEEREITAAHGTTKRIREKLIQNALTEWTFDDGSVPAVSVRPVPPDLDHASSARAKYVVIEKQGLRALWIRVDASASALIANDLERLADRGVMTVWVRWGDMPRRVPSGVAVLDLGLVNPIGA